MNINKFKPISILPAISKVFEQIVYERQFVRKYMFYWKQFGFRSKQSTIDARAEITERIGQGSNDTFICIMLDLRKTFDSINQEIL